MSTPAPPPGIASVRTAYAMTVNHLPPETVRTAQRLMDLVGPAGADAIRQLVVDSYDAGALSEATLDELAVIAARLVDKLHPEGR